MVQYRGVLSDDTVEKKKKKSSSKTKKPKKEMWGCENCPLNPKPGVDERPKLSVFEPLKANREVWILAMNPAYNEIAQRRNLCGRAGKWFWNRVEKLEGFTRAQCNVDNVVRCRSTEETAQGTIVEANPSKDALKCCHKHTLRRYEKVNPKVILLLGAMAQKQFLGKKFKKNKTIYWDEEKQCKVVCTYHPSYFARGTAKKEAYWAFDKAIREVKFTLKYPGRFGYIETLDYKQYGKVESVRKFFRRLKKERKPVSVDGEWGIVEGKKVMLCLAFSNELGKAGIIFYDHPDVKRNPRVTKRLKLMTCQFLADPDVRKILWHGVADVNELADMWGVQMQGYDLDGEYMEYFAHPNRKDFTLETSVDVRLKKMTGYKDIVDEYIKEELNFARVPIKALKIRCCGDADATRRLAMSNLRKVPQKLVAVYVDASFLLEEMGQRGILFDGDHCQVLRKVYKPLLKKTISDICMVAGDPEFETTDENLKRLFVKKLKIPLRKLTGGGEKVMRENFGGAWKYHVDDDDIREALKAAFGEKWYKGYGLDAEVLDELYDEYKIARLVKRKRFIEKLIGTYLNGFEESAKENGGYCRTRFKMTTASSGRLASSGGGPKKGVNLQNIHGDLSAQNILVSTLKWREIQRACETKGEREEEV